MARETLQMIGITQSPHKLTRQVLSTLATNALLLILRARSPASLWRSVHCAVFMRALRCPPYPLLRRRCQRSIRIATPMSPVCGPSVRILHLLLRRQRLLGVICAIRRARGPVIRWETHPGGMLGLPMLG